MQVPSRRSGPGRLHEDRRRSDGSKKLVGRWRIQEMDVWDGDALDLVGPAFIEFRETDP